MYLICHMTSHDHFTEGSCKFLDGSSLWYVTTLISLVTTSIVIVEIKFLICYLTSCEHIFTGLYKFIEGNPSW